VTLDRFRVGFLPLVDAALPVLARELGFAEAEGIDLELMRDTSWATVRDRLTYGHSDAAHLVAPLAIATTLGLDRPPLPLCVPFILGLNGNAVTLAPSLAAAVCGAGELLDSVTSGKRLAELVTLRASEGARLRFGVVHRYSSHNYMLQYWLRGSGVDIERDVEIVTISPPFAADALSRGEIDGICVGEPWNSVAVERGVGVIVNVTSHIWLRGVEKVLALPQARAEAEPELVHRVIRALYRAGEAFVDTGTERISRWFRRIDRAGDCRQDQARGGNGAAAYSRFHVPAPRGGEFPLGQSGGMALCADGAGWPCGKDRCGLCGGPECVPAGHVSRCPCWD
jgi:two-component system, oxyanion-binding sensor